jgi:hypothetical protein
MKPRTLCRCQPVVSANSVIVARVLRCNGAMISANLFGFFDLEDFLGNFLIGGLLEPEAKSASVPPRARTLGGQVGCHRQVADDHTNASFRGEVEEKN